MSSEWAKAWVIAAWLSGSASRKLSSVASEKTTPKPKVSSGRLRSRTVISWAGSAFFMRIAKYSPAAPPPTETIFTRSFYRTGAVRNVHVPGCPHAGAVPARRNRGRPGGDHEEIFQDRGLACRARRLWRPVDPRPAPGRRSRSRPRGDQRCVGLGLESGELPGGLPRRLPGQERG